jgi:general secretion pathway protein M
MINDFKSWFLLKTPREQLFLAIVSVALVISLLLALVLVPLQKKRDQQLANNASVLNQQIKVRDLASAVMAQTQTGGDQVVSLAQISNTSLRNQGLSMEDFQPTGENDVRIRLGMSEYNKVMAWLHELENKEAIQIAELTVAASDNPGILSSVSVRLHRN